MSDEKGKNGTLSLPKRHVVTPAPMRVGLRFVPVKGRYMLQYRVPDEQEWKNVPLVTSESARTTDGEAP